MRCGLCPQRGLSIAPILHTAAINRAKSISRHVGRVRCGIQRRTEDERLAAGRANVAKGEERGEFGSASVVERKYEVSVTTTVRIA